MNFRDVVFSSEDSEQASVRVVELHKEITNEHNILIISDCGPLCSVLVSEKASNSYKAKSDTKSAPRKSHCFVYSCMIRNNVLRI